MLKSTRMDINRPSFYFPDEIDERANLSDNTRRAYYSDCHHVTQVLKKSLPLSLADVLRYLELSAKEINPRTLRRRLAMIKKWHVVHHHPDPTTHPQISETLRSIARTHGKPKVKAKAIRLQELQQLVAYLDQHRSIFNIRTKALLLLGFYGAFRRSELVSLRWENIEFEPEGMVIRLARSKTDQMGEGQSSAIPFRPEAYCPVRTLLEWREVSGQHQGFVFRRITRVGRILSEPISSPHWNTTLKQLAHQAKLPSADRISSHSLRRGSTTEAASRGAPLMTLKRHGRWRSGASVLEYLEEGRQFKDSAASLLLDFNES